MDKEDIIKGARAYRKRIDELGLNSLNSGISESVVFSSIMLPTILFLNHGRDKEWGVVVVLAVALCLSVVWSSMSLHGLRASGYKRAHNLLCELEDEPSEEKKNETDGSIKEVGSHVSEKEQHIIRNLRWGTYGIGSLVLVSVVPIILEISCL